MPLLRQIASLVILVLLPGAGSCLAAATGDHDELLARYHKYRPQLERNVFGVPIYIESNGDNGTVSGDIYGILDHSFDTTRNALGAPASWCDIAPQHLNIKACTFQHVDSHCQLSFYTGRKFYEKADDVYRVDYKFRVERWEKNFFNIKLNAADGPLDTSNYVIAAEAIPLDNNTSFVHFHYSYEHGFVTDLAMVGYFATLGAGKIGFSLVDNESSEPTYVSGTRGVVERNAIRYYFAIQTFLRSLTLPPAERFESRLNQWYDLTEKYPAQLHEMDKSEYLQAKRMEHEDQSRLQAVANSAATAQRDGQPANGECLNTGVAGK